MSLHYNYELRWKNYRGFKDTGWIKIKPLTVILGPNNSGKTSFISPILLMAQTMASRDILTPIITSGKLTDLGTYMDLVNDYDTTKNIYFGFKYHTHEPDNKLKKLGEYPPGMVETEFAYDNELRNIFIKNQKVYDIFSRLFYRLSRTKKGNYRLDGIQSSKMRPKEKRAINKCLPLNFVFSPAPILYNIDRVGKEDKNYKSKQFSEEFSIFIQALGYNYSELRNIFGDLSYIGTIREKPQGYYQKSCETYNTVGSTGENTANLLYRIIKKVQPSLNKWINKFDFGDELLITNISDELFSLVFKNSHNGLITNIANAGFGASQIIPLICQALASPSDSLTIAEQPEIHLNPKLQCVLADLFSYMINKDQRLIVETHSEHLLLRLRRLIASKELNNDDVAIYFVEKDNSVSKIREIKVHSNGHIVPIDWPKDFFQDSLKESLALATAQSKKL